MATFEISVNGERRFVGDDVRAITEEAAASEGPQGCSFCGQDFGHIRSLVAGPQVAICDGCLLAFDAVVTERKALPLGASIQQDGDQRCGFCLKGVADVAGLLVRNAAAICPECLRVSADIMRDFRDKR